MKELLSLGKVVDLEKKGKSSKTRCTGQRGSWKGSSQELLCTVNCRPTVSNFQFSGSLKIVRGSNPERWEARVYQAEVHRGPPLILLDRKLENLL